MDRTSVLGDAINYVKHLKERVKTLEEQQEMKTENHKPVILMKKSLLCTVEDDWTSIQFRIYTCKEELQITFLLELKCTVIIHFQPSFSKEAFFNE